MYVIAIKINLGGFERSILVFCIWSVLILCIWLCYPLLNHGCVPFVELSYMVALTILESLYMIVLLVIVHGCVVNVVGTLGYVMKIDLGAL